MKPSDIVTALGVCMQVKRPAMLWGAPGVGKSQLMAQFAAANDMALIDVRAILFDPVDLRGIPFLQETEGGIGKRTGWAIPDFLPYADKHGERGILFIDELTAAPPSVQAAFYQLMLDRRLGDYMMPDGWYIFAAGNRETDRAVAYKMPSALANRLVHIDFDVNSEDWTAWAIQAGIAPEIIAFLRFKTALLHSFDPKERAFPTPRSWEFVSQMLPKLTRNLEIPLISGTVGQGAASEFIAFLNVWRDLPNPDTIILNPDSVAVSEKPEVQYAICGSLAHRVDEKNFENINKYMMRLPVEFQTMFMRDAFHRDKALASTATAIKWLSANSEVLL